MARALKLVAVLLAIASVAALAEVAASGLADDTAAGMIEMGSLSSAPEGGPEDDWSLNPPERDATTQWVHRL